MSGGAVLAAELLRTRRSAALRLTLVGPVVCLLALAGQYLVSGQRTWSALLLWHVPYVTTTAAVLTALLAAFAERRERRARTGGTAWRATPARARHAARVPVLAGLSLLTSVLAFLPFAPAGLLLGLIDPPVGRLLTAAVVVWAGGLGWLVVATALARALGPWPTVLAGVLWQLAGTLGAESAAWWALPPTWAVRPVLPLIGTHANGIPLEPGSPVWNSPAIGPVLASLALAVAALPLALLDGARPDRWTPPSRTDRRGAAGRHDRKGKRRIRTGRRVVTGAAVGGGSGEDDRARGVVAMAASLLRTAIGPLAGAAGLFLAGIAWTYPPRYPDAAFGLAVLPAGAAVLAVVAWRAQEPAWRIVCSRAARPWTAGLRLLAVLGLVVVAFTAVTAAVLALDGVAAPTVALRVLVAVPLGWAVVTLTLWLHARWHVAVALVVAFLGTTGGIAFGGSVLATTPLWLAGPAAWTWSAGTPDRAAVAVAASLLVTAVAGAGFLRAASRA
ncbi:hypothetical protein [Pseudonocardia sp. HH130630-07]|uniref:hypothetical protein n=1 Tax=Pseudonocardia sp. HH130630-07 TaxID=1690815 RepID=UPI000814E7F1|nr:hypothetical protein [Pseudonocardia sp. HH130630-07]ANY05234.1 hypothetical protein AFB00_01680 [Pseudonocardia sp. HH130630-07]